MNKQPYKKGIAGRSGDRPEKKAILDLSQYKNQRISVTLAGGIECDGLLIGYDPLQNLVLDECMIGKRLLGLAVVRSPVVSVISPQRVPCENPFLES